MARFIAGVLGLEPPAGRRRERGRVRAARRLGLRRAAPVEIAEPAESDRHRYVHFLAPDGKLYELVEERLNALLRQAVVEFGATVNAALVVIGDRLGLYREPGAILSRSRRRCPYRSSPCAAGR